MSLAPNIKWIFRHLKDKGVAGVLIVFLKVWWYPRYYRRVMRTTATNRAFDFLKHKGLDQYYLSVIELSGHISVPSNRKYVQNYLIYQMVRKLKPNTVLEFGSGWSTITIAAALNENFSERPENYQGARPLNHVIEGAERWAEITNESLPEHLKDFCKFYVSTPEIQILNGELCTLYDALPDVNPDMIYVDGPSLYDITGDVRGLSITRQVVADVKLYENKMNRKCVVIIDQRLEQLNYYLRNLVGYYRCTFVPLAQQFVLQKCVVSPPLGRGVGTRIFHNWVFSRHLKNEKNSTKKIMVKSKYSLLP